ncbi:MULTISPECIES: NAD(P)-dependent oxidoreductase [unclassified Saccharopolyspora]|uniref:NAD-dependent epimerase/dehydratase family protein n=1 Tax=unclassified Saccharopolyspora TaxID=2646250 RepID=UPI001CD2F8CD|nr:MULTISPECIES: NAD(P)-dependent oxidoreductase [unclassified Saccharopolyspora]MCA1188679.1 NAD(P)-dependent oxidoreductase [Saccharopolyspora sp. 6T]MCA1281082.1 NAD(P)-dependent oxidoreductase [Saccharopolyspora sp. 7B]
MTELLVTGATGFVGAATRRALRERGVRLRTLVHHRRTGGDDEQVEGDLADPASLRGSCAGVDAVVHLAAAVGSDPDTCRAVNDAGARALLAEARGAGVHRFVQLGTAAVYGRGEHRGPAEDEVRPRPESVTSETRLAGENAVLAAGGTVVRPYFVYGAGDRWVVPGLARLLAATGSTIEGARPRLGMVWVDDLAEIIAALAVDGAPPGRVLHADHPRPVPVRELVDRLVHDLGVPAPRQDLSYREAVRRLPGAADQLSLLARDRYFDATAAWRATGRAPTPFDVGFARSLDWYRAHLTADRTS